MLDVHGSAPDRGSPTAAGRSAQRAPRPAAAPLPPIFIGGAGRSGTTLLRVMLDSHSRIACGPELKVLPSVARLWAELHGRWPEVLADSHVQEADVDQAFAALVAGLLEPQRRASGKARIAEKTPNNVFVFGQLHRMFPDAAFVHVLRDGRDVVASLLTMDWTTTDGTPIDYTRDARLAARYWAQAVMAARTFARATAGNARFAEVRYEALVTDPERTLRALLAFLDEDWEPAVLDYHARAHDLGRESSAGQVMQPISQAPAGRWRRELSAADRQAVKQEVGGLLIELGYAADDGW